MRIAVTDKNSRKAINEFGGGNLVNWGKGVQKQ
jgi:hypothetical protein